MDIYHRLGQRIRMLRINQGLTQQALGEKSNLHQTYIGAVERGERNLSLKSLGKIASGLEVEVKDLFDFSDHASETSMVKERIDHYLRDKEERDIVFIRELLELIFQWKRQAQ